VTEVLYLEIDNAIKDRYPIADVPAPDAIRIRVAIGDLFKFGAEMICSFSDNVPKAQDVGAGG
jgi:hypothetical protein